jgi:CheY-like chemotaxis protein
MDEIPHYRLLVVDDNPNIHKDFTKILIGDKGLEATSAIHQMETHLFGKESPSQIALGSYVIDSAYQGEEAFKKVEASLKEKNPYALIFMDVLMPPGWDGVKASKEIWKIDPEVHIVICTAYADYSWEEIVKEVGVRHNFLIIKKPFESIEIRQVACCLTEKWNLSQQAGYKYDRLHQEVLKESEKLKTMLSQSEEKIRKIQSSE